MTVNSFHINTSNELFNLNWYLFSFILFIYSMSQLAKRTPANAARLGMSENRTRPKTALRLNFDDYDIIAQRSKRRNPYDIQPEGEVFRIKDEENAKKQREHKRFTRQPLMYRNCPSALPNLASKYSSDTDDESDASNQITSRNIIINPHVPFSEYGGIQPVGPEYKGKEQLNDFIEQKREILKVQLLIDRKNKEIERINQQRKAENAVFNDQMSKIAETKNQYKMTINQLEADLQRHRKAADAATKNKSELQANLKAKKTKLLAVENQISTNLEDVRRYRSYRDFLDKITVNIDKTKLKGNPQAILDELEYLENENLFLFEKCFELSNDKDSLISSLNAEISKAVSESQEMTNNAEKLSNTEIPIIDTHIKLFDSAEVQEIDTELQKLTVIIRNAYTDCFGKAADISPLMMLHRLETELEYLYKQSLQLPEKEIIEKQNAKEKERREKQRIEKQMQQILEQQAKNDAAIARSKMPVKKRTGRPLIERKIPIKVKRQVNKKNLDEEYQERLLFGDMSD